MHPDSHPLAGKSATADLGEGPAVFGIEDWWDRVGGESWMFCEGNPACLAYALRGVSCDLPLDDEVLYGKDTGDFGRLIHVSEIREEGP
ncbi:hypothetical protein ACH4FX_12080 [Streptomyces sp. NPDC018019]|uniref:hypothetical protein n=1 Tax=Streptomyces sp. NPDC018019 TaxID=3365030 RepID=UPI0037B38B07